MRTLQLNCNFQPKKVNFQKYSYCLNPRLFNDETFAFALQSDATVPLLASECILALVFFVVIFFSLLFIYGSFKRSRVLNMSSKTRYLKRQFYWAIAIQVSNFSVLIVLIKSINQLIIFTFRQFFLIGTMAKFAKIIIFRLASMELSSHYLSSFYLSSWYLKICAFQVRHHLRKKAPKVK